MRRLIVYSLLGSMIVAARAQTPLSLNEVDAELDRLYETDGYDVSACETPDHVIFIFAQVTIARRAEVFKYVEDQVVNIATFSLGENGLTFVDVFSGGVATVSVFQEVAEYLNAIDKSHVRRIASMQLSQLPPCPKLDYYLRGEESA